MRFDLSPGLCVIEFFATRWAFMKLQIWHEINLAFLITGPNPFHLFDLFAAAGWANCYFNHIAHLNPKQIVWKKRYSLACLRAGLVDRKVL
jgi:hypothetical protein